MHIKNNIIIFFSVTAIFSALFVNFIVIKSFTMIDINFISNMKEIYFDNKDIDENLYKEISGLLNSGNSNAFKKLLEDVGNPVSQFYGFAGFMKSNKITAIEYLKSGIMESPKKVKIIINKTPLNTTLGYAILLLLNKNPDWLATQLNDEFIRLTDKIILNIYNKGELSSNPDYKNQLVSMIQNKYPSIASDIINDFVSTKNIFDMSINEKKDVSMLLKMIDDQSRTKIIVSLLKEKDESILLNTLNFINTDDNTTINKMLDDMIQTTSYSDSVKRLLLNKYALTNKGQSLPKLIKFMLQNDTNHSLILEAIQVFEKYGDDSYWAFLTRYLGGQYSVEINNRVLTAITNISWKSNPDNVYSTLIFTIRRSNFSTAILAINFYIKNNISSNQSIILTRLRELDNDDIKKTALKYIEQFNITSATEIIINLSKDGNSEIKNAAIKLAGKLNIPL